MVFSEIYGNYFNAVSRILTEAVDKPVTDERIREIVNEKAFSESVLTIPDSLKYGKWPLLNQEGEALIFSKPEMPLTLLQKRWLKSLLTDPRIQLFQPDEAGLEDVNPLFDKDTFVYYDQYLDGDPYDNPEYIEHFRMILTAIKEKRKVKLQHRVKKGGSKTILFAPLKIEYSLKDDKFRVLGKAFGRMITINIARIISCQYSEEVIKEEWCKPEYMKREVELLLTDHRNALERAMLHFSHFEKKTEKIDEAHYRFFIRYEAEDETEVLIRVLSFGPLLKVIGPAPFQAQIKTRLLKQKSCGL